MMKRIMFIVLDSLILLALICWSNVLSSEQNIRNIKIMIADKIAIGAIVPSATNQKPASENSDEHSHTGKDKHEHTPLMEYFYNDYFGEPWRKPETIKILKFYNIILGLLLLFLILAVMTPRILNQGNRGKKVEK